MSTPKRRIRQKELRYNVIDPRTNYRGKSYSEWTTDWFNWFLSARADRHNSGPVVFLRSLPLPKSNDAANTSSSTVNTDASNISDPRIDRYYQPAYMNDPNIMVGSDRLQIYDDQAIFVPIINAYQFASISEHADWGSLQDFTGSLIDNGDNPPDRGQLSIKYRDGYEPVALPDDLTMEDFRVVTPIFTALVPDAPYGTSLKDFLEEGSISPGSYHAIVEGYFVMLKLEPGEYLINCFASSGREVQGYYFSQLIYEIEVRARRPEEAVIRGGMRPKIFPARNEGILNEILRRKKESGELDQKRVQDIQESNNNIRSLIGV